MSQERCTTPNYTEQERKAQVRDQYIAVAHMAKQIAKVYGELSKCAEHLPHSICGPKSASLLEMLGDVMNGDDIVEAEDAWIDPIIERAHAMYPAESGVRSETARSDPQPGTFREDAVDARRYRNIREHGIPCSQGDDCGSCTGDELDEQTDDAIAHPEKYDV